MLEYVIGFLVIFGTYCIMDKICDLVIKKGWKKLSLGSLKKSRQVIRISK